MAAFRISVHEGGDFFQSEGDRALLKRGESVESLGQAVLERRGCLGGEFLAFFSEVDVDFSAVLKVSLPRDQPLFLQSVQYTDHGTGAEVNVFGDARGDDGWVLSDGQEADELGPGDFVVGGELFGVHLYRSDDSAK